MNSHSCLIILSFLLSATAMPRSYALNITSLNPAEHDESEPALAGDSQFSIGSGSRTSQSLTGYRWYSPGGRLWQLDGMSFQVKNGTPWLFLVGGYDFQNKGAIDSVYGPNRYGGGKPGDLFIWYGQGTAPKNKGLHTPGTLGNAGLGYAYAVAIGDLITGGNLTVYDLNEDTLIDLTRGDGPFRDPWRVKPLTRNLAVDAAFVTLAEYYVGLTSGQVSEITGDEYPHVDTGSCFEERIRTTRFGLSLRISVASRFWQGRCQPGYRWPTVDLLWRCSGFRCSFSEWCAAGEGNRGTRSALEEAMAPGARPSRPLQPDTQSCTGFGNTNRTPAR
jgi:hypothetical protein